MSWILFRTSLRQQRPFLLLGLALLLLSLAASLFKPLALQAFSYSLYDEAQLGFALFQFLIAFALGSGLLVREVDEGTLGFLDGLPLTRSDVFAAKWLAAICVTLLYPLGELSLSLLLHLAARESLDHAIHPGLLLTHFALTGLVTAAGLALGLLLGFLRTLCWLALALCTLAMLLLQQLQPQLAAVLNPTELLTLHFVGTHWPLPMEAIWLQSGLTVLCSGLALALFRWSGTGRIRAWPLQLTGPVGSAVVALLALVIAIGAFVAIGLTQHKSSPDQEDARFAGVKATTIAPGHASTQHYSLSYPALSAQRVQQFVLGADNTFTAVAALLHIDGGARINVDLSGTVANAAGTAYLDRIRMELQDVGAMDTLAHETTHVFAKRLAGGQDERELSKMTVFNEGLAHWVERKLSAAGKATREDRLAAAIVSQRHLLSPRQLTDAAEMARMVDGDLKYPLGAALIEVFVQRYGAEAPKTLLQTLGHADFARGLGGYVLWEAAFQLSGFDLDLVLDDYARHLKQLALEFAPQIAALPRPRGSLIAREGETGVQLHWATSLPAGWRPLVRFRPDETSALDQYRTVLASSGDSDKAVAWLANDKIAQRSVCFQPGLRGDGLVVYEPWQCLPWRVEP